MAGNRPMGRQKVTGNGSANVFRRGSGLGFGRTGSGSTPPPPGGSGGGGGNRNYGSGGNRGFNIGGGGKAGGCVGIIVVIILIIVFATQCSGGGAGNVLGNVLGGTSDHVTSYDTGSASDSLYDFFGSDSTAVSDWTDQAPTTALDSTVATGSREKYTVIKGGGRDEITVMIYLCGTDLESGSGMATRDLVEMTNATLSDKVHVLVYTGGTRNWNNNVVSSSVNQIYEIRDGGLERLVENDGTDAMTKPATLTRFIKYCADRYPSANRKELILWDHGGGSVSGFGYDEKNQMSGSMTLAGIKTALKDAGQKFDFIGYDACLMATVENGLMLDDFADYMIASEESEPGIGWYYTNWLTDLSKNTSMPTTEIGKEIVDDFVSQCARNCNGQAATLSLVDVAELSNTVPADLKNFSKSIKAYITDNSYKTVSAARNNTREFATRSRIDQIDLAHFATNLGNAEGNKLADTIKGAVKYNRTSTNMTNAYGLSIYFPYRSAKYVDSAINTYQEIGMDDDYASCIREFAGLETAGIASYGGTGSPLSSLFGGGSLSSGSLLGSLLGGSSSSGDFLGGSSSGGDISDLIGSFLGGDVGSVDGLSSLNSGFLSGRDLSDKETIEYISNNRFDETYLEWQQNEDGRDVIVMPESQWDMVTGVALNMFYDDGEGYINLGRDNIIEYDGDGNLVAADDHTWLAMNGHAVAFFVESTQEVDGKIVTEGCIPALLNGERVEIMVVFDDAHPTGFVTGARRVYAEGETDTVAKNMVEIVDGDTIDFICDYYSYDGELTDNYALGEQLVVDGDLELLNLDIGSGRLRETYVFTDIYQREHWTPYLSR